MKFITSFFTLSFYLEIIGIPPTSSIDKHLAIPVSVVKMISQEVASTRPIFGWLIATITHTLAFHFSFKSILNKNDIHNLYIYIVQKHIFEVHLSDYSTHTQIYI